MIATAPALPPYGKIDATLNQCILNASNRYGVPELLLHSILMVENGTKGQCVRRSNGTMDCGIGQINTVNLTELAKNGITVSHLAHDNCLNVQVSAYYLKKFYLYKNNDWTQAITAYNIGPNSTDPKRLRLGQTYATKVIGYWNWFYKYVVNNKNYKKDGYTQR